MPFWISGYENEGRPTMALYGDNAVNPLWQAVEDNPSWLVQQQNLLFAACERDDGGAVALYQRAQGGKSWLKADALQIDGTALCHLAAHPAGLLAGACWGSGHVFVARVQRQEARFASLLMYLPQTGPGTGPSRAHFVQFVEDDLFTVNLGLDCVIRYRLAPDLASIGEVGRLALPPQSGPRHLCFAPQHGLFYCVSEYSNQLFTARYDEESMQLVDAQSTLAPGHTGQSDGSAICTTADGRFLYTANRGEDTVACFKLGANGLPAPAGRFACGGHWPRHMALMDGDATLAVANQRSGQVVLFARDAATGALTKECDRIPWANASFVGECTQP